MFPASGTALVLFRESSVALTLCYVSFEWCYVVVFPASGNALVLVFADGVAIVLFYAYGIALLLFPTSGVASALFPSTDVPRFCFLRRMFLGFVSFDGCS